MNAGMAMKECEATCKPKRISQVDESFSRMEKATEVLLHTVDELGAKINPVLIDQKAQIEGSGKDAESLCGVASRINESSGRVFAAATVLRSYIDRCEL